MQRGVIKRIKPFSQEEGKYSGGFGFISVEGEGDLFFHAKGCVDNGFVNLYEGDSVNFDIVESKKRPGSFEAMNVKIIN